jgi:hypothetical protein
MTADADRQAEMDIEVFGALVTLWARSRWPRLEAGLSPGPPAIVGGYCLTPQGITIDTAAALNTGNDCPETVRQLVCLLIDTGWQRLEIVGRPGSRPGGNCRRHDGTHVFMKSALADPLAELGTPWRWPTPHG